MGLLGIAGSVLGGLSSLGGLFGASDAAKRAEQERQNILNQLAVQNDAAYQNQLGANSRTLYGMAGTGGDAIAALGRRLGDSLAGSGVYNSSAVAGTLQGAQRDENSALADLAQRLQTAAWQQRQQGLMQIGNERLGVANQQVNYAQNNLGEARGGLASFLGNLAQNNLARSGANTPRPQIPAVNGTTGQGANLPGNAGYVNNPVASGAGNMMGVGHQGGLSGYASELFNPAKYRIPGVYGR